jgi:hypothetical protein
MTTETTPAMQEVPTGMTEDAAASELLKRWGASEDTPQEEEAEEAAEESQTEEVTSETEEESAEEEPQESEEVEIDVAGEKIKLPAVAAEVARKVEAKVKEIEAGATRKFQEASELRKVAEAQTEHAKQIGQLSQQEVDLLADARTIDRRLQHILSIDVNALHEQDPATLARLTAEAQQLQFARQRVDQALQEARGQKQVKVQEQEASRFKYLSEWSQKNIKGWSDEYSQTLLEFSVKELGADPNTLRSVMSEPVLKALDLAYKGWKVQTAVPKDKQVVATKTLKPGSTGQVKTNAQATAVTATRRLAQTKSVEDAAAALLARSNAKKRR